MDCSSVVVCDLLRSGGMDPGLAMFIALLLGVVLVTTIPLVTVIFLIWVERKVAARIQDRLGPNRVGPFGLLQTFADMIKLITKENITPANADRVVYNFAPLLSVVSVVLIWAVIPFTPYHIGTDLEIGALYIVAVASLGTLAIMTAGWASNNKYALLGAFRVVAQLVSYEVPLVFALLVPIMLAGSMGMQDIVYAQAGMWFFFMVPLSAVLLFIASHAETGRGPFDLIEAESEIIAGFNIEYSGMKFGMFFAAEFIHVFTNAVLMAVFFFGGWWGPGALDAPLLALLYLGLKSAVIYFIYLWVRNTFPRVRIDQLLDLNWKFFVPLSIVNVLVVAFVLKILQELQIAVPLNASTNFLATIPMTVVLLLVNVAMTYALIAWLRNRGAKARQVDLANQHEDIVVAGAAGD